MVLLHVEVTRKLGSLCFYLSSVLVDSFIIRNPPKCKARKLKQQQTTIIMETSLKILKNSLKNLIDRLVWKAESVTVSPNNPSQQKLNNLNNLRTVVTEFGKLGIFEEYVNNLKDSAIFTTSNNEMNILGTEANAIIRNLTTLKTLSENFLKTLAKTLPEENQNSINIKLPAVKDFDELSNVSREIHISLSQVLFNDEIKGETKIVSVENGSIWFNVFVGVTSVSVVASLAWAAAVIYKKMQEGKLLAQQVRGLMVKNESLEDILKAQKAETELMINAEATHINSEYFKTQVPENLERIKNSIKIFSELIDKGAEIQPALVAPEQVSNLFPDIKNIVGLESKIKKIANVPNNK